MGADCTYFHSVIGCPWWRGVVAASPFVAIGYLNVIEYIGPFQGVLAESRFAGQTFIND